MTTLKFGAILINFSAMFLVLFPHIPGVVYDMIVGNPIEITTSGICGNKTKNIAEKFIKIAPNFRVVIFYRDARC